MKGFINANVYITGKGIVKTSVGFEKGVIAYIGDDLTKIDEVIELSENLIVLPGFIDQHIHGAGGADAMDGNTSALSTIANTVAKEGTVAFLATTMTQSKQNILKALSAVKEYKSQKREEGAEVLGVHLEGPFISDKHIGAQPLEFVQEPSVELFDEYYEASGKSIKIISIAPEVEGASQLVSHLNDLGVAPSAGHTDSGYNDIERAISFGLKGVTHTFNAQKALHHREIGTVGSAMLFDELYTEAICDCIHLSVPAIKLLMKNKPKDKFTLVTDAMRAKGLADGISELGGQTVIVKNGEARLENGALAGSVLKMNDAIKNLVTKCGVSLSDAVDFASINPAKNLNIDGLYGSIEVGKKANFAVLDENFTPRLTIRDGEIIFQLNIQ